MSANDNRLAGPALSDLSTDLREQRLRTTIDELRWSRDALRRENTRLRDRCEKQTIKLQLLRQERHRLDQRIQLMEREMRKLQ